MSRFAAEGGAGRMNRGWLAAIILSVFGVLLLAVILGALGIGGLDDAARALVRGVAFLGLWTLRPVLLLLGLLAAGLVAIGNWVSGLFGGGDLSGLELARLQIEEFHESLRDVEGEGPPNVILTVIKWLAFLAALSLAGWVLFRMFRRRRLVGGNYAEGEMRESIFSWEGAGPGCFRYPGRLGQLGVEPAPPPAPSGHAPGGVSPDAGSCQRGGFPPPPLADSPGAPAGRAGNPARSAGRSHRRRLRAVLLRATTGRSRPGHDVVPSGRLGPDSEPRQYLRLANDLFNPCGILPSLAHTPEPSTRTTRPVQTLEIQTETLSPKEATMFQRINPDELNGRQKEIYNFQKSAALLADYGFNCIKLTDDWQGADFLAYHFDGTTTLKVQLKGRLTINRKYAERDLWMNFPCKGTVVPGST